MRQKELAAYLAGAIDADGSFGIRKSKQRMRNGDCATPTYSERVILGQVTPQVPELLRGTFGGCIYKTKPGTKNSRPMFRYMASDATAVRIAEFVLPYLQIKAERAECLIELRKWRTNHDARKVVWWFVRENPLWEKMPLLTTTEVATRLGYARKDLVLQSLSNGTLVSIPTARSGKKEVPRFPAELIDRLLAIRRNKLRYPTAPQLTATMESIYMKIRGMNKLGVNGCPQNFLTGAFAPKDP